MKLDWALTQLHRAEGELARQLRQAADRHRADHEIFYLANDLALWSDNHVAMISDISPQFGVELQPDSADAGIVSRALDKGAQLVEKSRDPALRMLEDLRELYLSASAVSVDWELLAQAAQGARQHDLLEVAETCHPDTLRQMRWANSKLKESATQALLA